MSFSPGPALRHLLRVLLPVGIILPLAGTAFVWAAGTPDPIQGRVTDLSDRPLFSALVELRVGDRTIVSTRTRSDGTFELRPGATTAGGPRTLRVSSLGFRTEEVEVLAETGVLHLKLSPAPLPLDGLEVEGTRDICTRGDEPAARELWEAATRRHLHGLDTLGLASYTRIRVDTLPTPSTLEPGMEGAQAGQRGSAPLLRLAWARRLDREGYAFSVRRSDRERSFDSWSYPPLEADYTSHFGEAVFGRLNHFHLEREWDDGWRIGFCSRNTRRPHLAGTLELGPDTSIVRVDWRFRTPDPDEGAGGWVRFIPPGPDGVLKHLLPLESVTWRSTSDSLVVRRAQWYEDWVLAPGDSVPFLPARTASGPLP